MPRFLIVFTMLLAPFAAAQEAAPSRPASEALAPVTPDATTSGVAAVVTAESPAKSPVQTTSGFMAWVLKLKSGGLVVGFQILLSVIAGAYAVGCWVTIKKDRIVPDGLAKRAMAMWREGKIAELEALEQKQSSTLARAISFLVTHRDNNLTDVTTTTGDLANGEISAITRRTYPIAVIANLLPLLGLLGTVIGMIECFDTVAVAGELGDPSLLASGISKALVTTAVGLTLAIPLLYIYHYFKSRINTFGDELEGSITRMTAEWFLRKSDKSDGAV